MAEKKRLRAPEDSAGESVILIVDDDPSALKLLEALLSESGYRPVLVSDGAEALAKAAELTPDLILLDVMMPDMSGFEVCRRLRADPRLAEVPVVMVTALGDRNSRLQGIEAGADDFVTKPFDHVELLARVRNIVQLDRYRRLLSERTRRQQAEDEIHQLYQKLQRHADNLEETVAQRTRELEIERDRTRAILETLSEAVIVIDAEGAIQYVNPAAVEMTGFASAEMRGQNWRLWQSKPLPAEFYAQMQDTIRAGQIWRGETVNQRKDGAFYDAAVTLAPLFDPHNAGQLSGFVSVQRDITPLKEAERLKNQFVSDVSHELRTPLSIITLISGNLDTLYDRLDDSRRRKMIRDIREHTQSLNDLIGDVLEISRIDSGRVSIKRQEVNLAQLARQEVDKQLPLAQKRGQTLRVTGAESLVVWGNDGQLRQVIRNLLNNAIKYTPKGGRITCECLAQGNRTDWAKGWPGSAALPAGRWAALRVVDSGTGISQEDQSHLFERFYRVQTQGNVPGTGLGLSIAQELVDLHGGRITVAAPPDEGSVFAIYLPLPEEESL